MHKRIKKKKKLKFFKNKIHCFVNSSYFQRESRLQLIIDLNTKVFMVGYPLFSYI